MKRSIWTLIMGILMIGAGVLALIHPFPASVTVTVFFGWSFVFLGALQLVSAFRDAEGGQRLMLLLLAVLMIWVGFAILNNPLRGLVTLTFVVALSFIASGIVKLFAGWSLRSFGLGGWVMLSGLVSIALGVMVVMNMSSSAPDEIGAWTSFLGIILGIELISDGLAVLFMWHASRQT